MIHIVKASMGASHQVNFLLEILFLDVDFKQKYIEIGSIRIEEVYRFSKFTIKLYYVSIKLNIF